MSSKVAATKTVKWAFRESYFRRTFLVRFLHFSPLPFQLRSFSKFLTSSSSGWYFSCGRIINWGYATRNAWRWTRQDEKILFFPVTFTCVFPLKSSIQHCLVSPAACLLHTTSFLRIEIIQIFSFPCRSRVFNLISPDWFKSS